MTVTAIRLVADLSHFLFSTLAHPTLFPYPLALLVHAARVSISFQNNARASGNQGKLPWGTHVAGFLIMAWGSSILTHALLALPPPHLYSADLWISYLSIHIISTAASPSFASTLTPRLLDTVLPLPDAILRVHSIISALGLAQTHPDERLRDSLFLQLLLGAIAASSGGIIATTLNVWTPEWRFTTPVVFRGGLLATLDVWSGTLIAVIYGLLTASHPTYQCFFSNDFYTRSGPLLTGSDANAVAVLVLAGLYAWRAACVHWLATRAKKAKEKQL